MKNFIIGLIFGIMIVLCINVFAFNAGLAVTQETPDIDFKKTSYLMFQYEEFGSGSLLDKTHVTSKMGHFSTDDEAGRLETEDILVQTGTEFFTGNVPIATALLEILHQQYINEGILSAEDTWN